MALGFGSSPLKPQSRKFVKPPKSKFMCEKQDPYADEQIENQSGLWTLNSTVFKRTKASETPPKPKKLLKVLRLYIILFYT